MAIFGAFCRLELISKYYFEVVLLLPTTTSYFEVLATVLYYVLLTTSIITITSAVHRNTLRIRSLVICYLYFSSKLQ